VKQIVKFLIEIELFDLQSSEMEGGIEVLMERMRKLTEEQQEMTQEELVKRFQKLESQSAECKQDFELQYSNMGTDNFESMYTVMP